MQGSFLRSACFPLMKGDPNWNGTLQYQMAIHQREFQQISQVTSTKLKDLQANAIANGFRALPLWLDDNWGKGEQFVTKTFFYMNDNFNDGSQTLWNVFLTEICDEVNFAEDIIFYRSKNGATIFVNFGRLNCPPYTSTVNYPFGNSKTVTTFKIGGKGVNLKGVCRGESWPDLKYYSSFLYSSYECLGLNNDCN